MPSQVILLSSVLLLCSILLLGGGYVFSTSYSESRTLLRANQVLSAKLMAAEAHLAQLRARANDAAPSCACESEKGPVPAGISAAAAVQWKQTPDNQRLFSLFQSVANSRGELLLALANDVMMCTNRKTCWWNGGNVLETFLKSLRRLHVQNFVVVTLDDATESFCQRFGGVPSLRLELPVPTAQQGSRGANMISTLKYGLLEQALLMGFSILVADLDLVFLRDPFDHLYRDADIEGSTDGFTKAWAEGSISSVHEPRMGWGAGGLYVQHFTMNVGCAFIRPTERSIDLMRRVAYKLSLAAAWDQQVFNAELFIRPHGRTNGSLVSVRIMEYDMFMNSKVFFFTERKRFFPGESARSHLPVMIHMNYHPDKHARMLCVWDRYIEGKPSACDHFPAGSDQ